MNDYSTFILIDQYRFYIAQYFKQENGQWVFNDYEGEEAVLNLTSVNFEISFSDLYERVDFELD